MIEPGDTVVQNLAGDLAGGLLDKPVRITASGATAAEAAGYWRQVLAAAGLMVLGSDEPESGESARIHLHEGPGAATSYSATGLALEEMSNDLVGEVVGLGESAADRLSTLIAVADAVANVLAERT
jgi:hypothetical protein